MMGKQRWLLALIVGLTIAAIFVITQLPTRLGLDLRGGTQLTLLVKPTAEIPTIGDREMEGVQRVVAGRVNELGVSETPVQRLGQNQLLVQLPGVSDPAQAQRVLGETARLEFRSQRPGTEQLLAIETQILAEHRSTLEALLPPGSDPPPEDSPLAAEIAAVQADIQASNAAILELFEPSDLSGDRLRDAFARPMQGGGDRWEVVLEFTNEGGALFAQLSRDIAGTGRSIGIFLDDRLLSAPTVDVQYAETGITGNGAVISGSFRSAEAADLSIQLRGGALPLPVEVVETRTVGPTLGRDSIERSLYAGLVGLVLVLIYMVVYYRLPGLLADVSLVVYSLLTLAAFNLLGVTLTLPGIAGFILSIGMAVDANVLIFERTREELTEGKTLYRSVEGGFYRAFSSILDSNVTTLIACGALFWLGAGLVKGFALTLAIGVVISMFTAITCTRTLLLWVVLSIPKLRAQPQLFIPSRQLPSVAAKP